MSQLQPMQFQAGGELNPYAPPTTDAEILDPSSSEEGQIPAARSTRLGGALLDNMLYVGVATPGIVASVAETAWTTTGWAIAGVMVFGLAVYQWYLISTTGQSLAKKWLGMRIVKVDGTPVTFVSGVILRNWVMLLMRCIPYFGALIGLTDAVMIFQREQRCLHDVIAGTKVIMVFRHA